MDVVAEKICIESRESLHRLFGIPWREEGSCHACKAPKRGQSLPRRRMNSCTTGVEAMLNWSLSSDILYQSRDMAIAVFCVSHDTVHVSVTHVVHRQLETQELFFGSEVAFEDFGVAVREALPRCAHLYFFTPSKFERHQLSERHLGRYLNCQYLPSIQSGVVVMTLDMLSQIARRACTRRIGADAKRWLELISASDSDEAHESLSLAVKADAAALLRLLVTPTQTLFHAA